LGERFEDEGKGPQGVNEPKNKPVNQKAHWRMRGHEGNATDMSGGSANV